MSQIYTPGASPARSASFTLPSNREQNAAESVNDALRKLADNDAGAYTDLQAAEAATVALAAVVAGLAAPGTINGESLEQALTLQGTADQIEVSNAGPIITINLATGQVLSNNTEHFDASSAAGWTAAAPTGGTTALVNIIAGYFELTINTGVTANYVGGAYNGPRILRPVGPWSSVWTRLSPHTWGGATSCRGGITIENAAKSEVRCLLVHSDGARVRAFNATTNNTYATIAGAVDATTGNDWLGLIYDGARLFYVYGTGTATCPPRGDAIKVLWLESPLTIEFANLGMMLLSFAAAGAPGIEARFDDVWVSFLG